MPIPNDYPGMTSSQLDSYISDFLAAIYGEEVRDKFARIAYLIGHQIPASVEPSVQAAAASAVEAAEEAENAASSANSAAGSANSAYGSMRNASQSATNAANSAAAAKTAQTAAEAAQEAAENAAQNATDAAGGNFLPKSGGTLTGILQETAGSYVWNARGTIGTDGFVNIAEISLANMRDYQDSPIELTVFRRHVMDRARLIMRFGGRTADDAFLVSFYLDVAGGSSTNDFYLHKSATSTWQLYVRKSDPYDHVGIGEFHTNFSHISYKVTFKDIQVSSVPSGSRAATQLPVASHTHNYAGSSSAGGVANSAKKLSDAQTIDGVAFDGSSSIIHYGTCSTAAATAAKVVQCDGFKLVTGARIAVKFTYKNTYAASPVQLNVNGTGAKYARMYDDQHSVIMWEAGAIVEFIYDGSQYLMNSASTAVTLVNVLPVAKGGTGATTAAQARANLGVFNADPVYSRRVTVFGQTSADNYIDIKVYKIGFVCFVNVSSMMMTDGSNGVTFQEFELPESCTPLTSAFGVAAEIAGATVGGITRWEITGDRKVKFTASNPASWFERHCCFSYVADNSGW